MKRTILALALCTYASLVGAQAPQAAPNAQKVSGATLPGTCTITNDFLMTDMRLEGCFPQFDAEKCAYYSRVPLGVTKGASNADVTDAKKHGLKVMDYASTQACEGKNNCGFYVVQFASAAACDGAVVKDMPGGEYRGLTAAAAINIQKRANKESESASASGKSRGDKTKNPRNKGKVWGAED